MSRKQLIQESSGSPEKRNEAYTNDTVPWSQAYDEIQRSLIRMKAPLSGLLETHDQFVLQNLGAMNDIKTIKTVRRKVERSIERSEQRNKKNEHTHDNESQAS